MSGRWSRAALGLAVGDAAVLLTFVVVGMQTHSTLEQGDALTRFAVLAGPLLLAWAMAAPALRAWPLDPPHRWRTAWGRTLAAWLIAAPLALLTRALLTGSPTLSVPFLVVALGVGGLMLLAWRSLYLYLWVARPRAP